MKSGIVLVARTGSTRLKNKIFKNLGSFSVFEILINRIKKSSISNIVLATTRKAEDDVLVEFAKKRELSVFRGSAIDTLDRLYQCASKFGFENVILVEGDEVCTDPMLVNKTVKLLERKVANLVKITKLPVGMLHLGLSAEILGRIWSEIPRGNSDGWGAKLMSIDGIVVNELEIPQSWLKLNELNYRLTLDYPEDFELIDQIYKAHNYPPYLDTDSIVNYLVVNPQLSKINAHKDLDWRKNLDISDDF